MENLREFASSTNGDRWFLGVDTVTNAEFVIHHGNPSSGGHKTTTPVTSFLEQRPFGPEREALVMLLANRRGTAGENMPGKAV